LRVVSQLSQSLSGPVLSSNLCLAWDSLQTAGIDLAERAPTPSLPLLGGWEHLIDAL
jgi:maleate cis-trans isomerase